MDSNCRFLVARPSNRSWETGLLHRKRERICGEPEVRIHLPQRRVRKPSSLSTSARKGRADEGPTPSTSESDANLTPS